ncbi:MAG: tyrosine--tRNA ligase [Planctomycetes bacterium]|nr:tyrosine--tRNA ligase [Planctomycetota bacterium]
MLETQRQLEAIRRGTVTVLREEELRQKLEKSLSAGKPLRVKLGVDPTAPDIHLGHTVVLEKLRLFQDLGHQAVLIIGDYTAMVGDPSGTSKTRPQLTREKVLENAQTYLEQVDRILLLDRLEVVYNGEWFRSMTFEQVLRLAARLTVSRMLERDDFRKRYESESPIGLHELLYPLMQGYDSVRVRSDVELGGTDQTFNLLVGREMQKAEGMEPQVCITYPLLIGLDGVHKMSKSLGNTVGVRESAREMFGKLMSLADSMMRMYLELLTSLPESEVQALLSEGTHPREAKERLAREIVARYHGRAASEAEAEEFRRVFSRKELPQEMPEVVLEPGSLQDGRIWLVKLMHLAGHAASHSEARRLIEQGAVSVDGVALRDPQALIAPRTGAVLQVGKRRFARIRSVPLSGGTSP